MKAISNFAILAVLIIFIFSVISCTTPRERQKPPDPSLINLPVLSAAPDGVKDLRAEAFCSETKIGTAAAILTWGANDQVIDKQRLDITFHKKGFEKNLYTTLWPLKKNHKFQTTNQVKLPDRLDYQALYLNVIEADFDKQKKTMSVWLEDLDPGIIYFCRICTLSKDGWVPSIAIEVDGPFCPADLIEQDGQH